MSCMLVDMQEEYPLRKNHDYFSKHTLKSFTGKEINLLRCFDERASGKGNLIPAVVAKYYTYSLYIQKLLQML